MNAKSQSLSKQDALRAYARMLNNLSVDYLEPLLEENFHYASQNVIAEITSKAEFLNHMRGKLATIKRAGARVWAEVGKVDAQVPVLSVRDQPCLIIAQDDKENLVGILLVEVEGQKIKRADMATVAPAPQSAKRSGEYPL